MLGNNNKTKGEMALESNAEKFGVAAAITFAVVFVYATFPSLQGVVMPSSSPLWEPLLSGKLALGIVGAFAVIGVFLAVFGRFRRTAKTGESLVPTLIWVALFALVVVGLSAFVAMIAFGFTYQTMIGYGQTHAMSLALALFVAIMAFWFICRK